MAAFERAFFYYPRLPITVHADALCAGSPSLASELGLVEQRYDCKIMVKVLASAA